MPINLRGRSVLTLDALSAAEVRFCCDWPPSSKPQSLRALKWSD